MRSWWHFGGIEEPQNLPWYTRFGLLTQLDIPILAPPQSLRHNRLLIASSLSARLMDLRLDGIAQTTYEPLPLNLARCLHTESFFAWLLKGRSIKWAIIQVNTS
jgi:hypothetical protein